MGLISFWIEIPTIDDRSINSLIKAFSEISGVSISFMYEFMDMGIQRDKWCVDLMHLKILGDNVQM